MKTINEIKNSLKGLKFKNLLEQKEITKYRLSKDCEVSYRTLCHWQRGDVEPSDEKAMKIGKYLNLIEMDDIEFANLRKDVKSILKRFKRIEEKRNK